MIGKEDALPRKDLTQGFCWKNLVEEGSIIPFPTRTATVALDIGRGCELKQSCSYMYGLCWSSRRAMLGSIERHCPLGTAHRSLMHWHSTTCHCSILIQGSHCRMIDHGQDLYIQSVAGPCNKKRLYYWGDSFQQVADHFSIWGDQSTGSSRAVRTPMMYTMDRQGDMP